VTGYSEQNVEVVQRAVEALNRGDFDSWMVTPIPRSSGMYCQMIRTAVPIGVIRRS
jgi:sulfite reductase beta subunit-like hemoprotein